METRMSPQRTKCHIVRSTLKRPSSIWPGTARHGAAQYGTARGGAGSVNGDCGSGDGKFGADDSSTSLNAPRRRPPGRRALAPTRGGRALS